MKNKINLIFYLFFFIISAKAQFNTVVNKNIKSIKVEKEEFIQAKEDTILVRTKDSISNEIYFSLPLDTIIITSRYGKRIHPTTGKKDFHKGIDMRAKSNYIYSVMPGKITKTGKNRLLGNYVEIEHGKFKSLYAHLSQILVNKKDVVTAGKKIGITGNTGRTTGEHLHFAVTFNGKYTDPKIILDYIAKVKNVKL